MKSKEDDILINILTRTSNRPIGFENCHKSIINQTYTNVKHIVSYESDFDFEYINYNGIDKIKVNKYNGDVSINTEGHAHAPYNLYCNSLLNHVNEGWILFLDDDDNLLHNKVLEEIVNEIKKVDNDTMLIWKMRYPDGRVLPLKKHFKKRQIEFENIGSPCVLFHSKFKNIAKWDDFKAADFRFINSLFENIPNKRWIEKVYIQINNFGGFGKRNDFKKGLKRKIIFNKNLLWYLIPKYHSTPFNYYVFQLNTYKNIFEGFVRKIKKAVLDLKSNIN